MKNRIILSLLVALLSGCAGRQLQVPRASQQGVDLERQHQLGLIYDKQDLDFRSRIEEWRRIFTVYSRLRTGATDLCKADVKPVWGMWLADETIFPTEDQGRAKRLFGIDHNLGKVTLLTSWTNSAAFDLGTGNPSPLSSVSPLSQQRPVL